MPNPAALLVMLLIALTYSLALAEVPIGASGAPVQTEAATEPAPFKADHASKSQGHQLYSSIEMDTLSRGVVLRLRTPAHLCSQAHARAHLCVRLQLITFATCDLQNSNHVLCANDTHTHTHTQHTHAHTHTHTQTHTIRHTHTHNQTHTHTYTYTLMYTQKVNTATATGILTGILTNILTEASRVRGMGMRMAMTPMVAHTHTHTRTHTYTYMIHT